MRCLLGGVSWRSRPSGDVHQLTTLVIHVGLASYQANVILGASLSVTYPQLKWLARCHPELQWPGGLMAHGDSEVRRWVGMVGRDAEMRRFGDLEIRRLESAHAEYKYVEDRDRLG